MATTLQASAVVAYSNGSVTTQNSLAGKVGTDNRVIRYTFTTPSSGATEFSISITGVSMYSSSYPTLRFFLTTDPASHINAAGESVAYDGVLIRATASGSEKGEHKYTSDVVTKTLLPDTTYYLYVFNGNAYARSAYFPYDGKQYSTNLATIIVEGSSTYTVSYDANGGTGAPASQTKIHGTALTLSSTKPTKASTEATGFTVTFNANGGTCDTASLTSEKTTKYTFSKWNTKADGSGTSYNSGASYTANAALELYAQYTPTTTNGSITLPTATRSGYTFLGWATSATATSGSTGSYTPTKTVTLYAVWGADGLVYIEDGTSFEGYMAYIEDGSSWALYVGYEDNGTSWDLLA